MWFRVNCRTKSVKSLHRRSPKGEAVPASPNPEGRRRVENLLTTGEFPVEQATTKFFLSENRREFV
jgi:hypothetical protein